MTHDTEQMWVRRCRAEMHVQEPITGCNNTNPQEDTDNVQFLSLFINVHEFLPVFDFHAPELVLEVPQLVA